MIGTIIWLIGVACAIWCVMDIFKKNISTAGKVIAAIVVLRRVSETRLFFLFRGGGCVSWLRFKARPAAADTKTAPSGRRGAVLLFIGLICFGLTNGSRRPEPLRQLP